jgi:hypothetical protein
MPIWVLALLCDLSWLSSKLAALALHHAIFWSPSSAVSVCKDIGGLSGLLCAIDVVWKGSFTKYSADLQLVVEAVG